MKPAASSSAAGCPKKNPATPSSKAADRPTLPANTMGIFFDIDNTLYNQRLAEGAGIHALADQCAAESLQEHDLEYGRVVTRAYFERIRHEILYGLLDKQRFTEFFTKVGMSLVPTDEDMVGFSRIFSKAYNANRHPCPGAVETLTILHDAGFHVHAIGADDGEHDIECQKLKDVGLSHLVDSVVMPLNDKPNPRRAMLEMAFWDLRLSPARTFVIGDMTAKDAFGVLATGSSPILYDPGAADN